MKKGRYLITGCAGFIGSNLVKKIYKKYDLILVDDLSEGTVFNLPKELRKKLIKKKVQNIKKLKTKKLDGIFHLAAQSSVPFSLTNFYKSSTNNIESSLKVFEFSKQFSAPIVYASSSAVYGNLPIGNDEKEKYSLIDWIGSLIGFVVIGFIVFILLWPLIDPTPDKSSSLKENIHKAIGE